MNKRIVTKLIVRSVAVAFGLIGLLFIGMGLDCAVTGIREYDRFAVFFGTPIFILLGGILLAIAWQNLRHFGPEAIQNVTALVIICAWSDVSALLEPLQETTSDLGTGSHYEFAKVFIPMLLAYLFYRALSRKLIEITKPENTQRHDAADAATRGD